MKNSSRRFLALSALTLIGTSGCTVLNGIPTDTHRPLPPFGDSANNGAGMPGEVVVGSHHGDSTPEKAVGKTGSGTDIGR